MKIKCLKYLLLLPTILLFFGCSSDSDNDDVVEPTPIPNPVITLEKDSVLIPNTGGAAEIRYIIENLIEGEILTIADVPEWITDVNTQDFGVIKFNVKENVETAPREVKLCLNYKNVEESSFFVVKQEAADPRPFTFKINDLTKLSIDADIQPLDPNIEYLVFCEPASSSNVPDDELFNNDMNYLKQMAEYNSMSLNDYLKDIVNKGFYNIHREDLYPDTEYTLYAYGIDTETLVRTTEIERLNIHTKSVEMINVKFDVDAKVENGQLYVNVNPNEYTGKYFSSILKLKNKDFVNFTPEQIRSEVNVIWMSTRALYIELGMTAKDMIYDNCISGTTSNKFDLEEDALYILVNVAVNDEALLCSNCEYKFVTYEGIIENK